MTPGASGTAAEHGGPWRRDQEDHVSPTPTGSAQPAFGSAAAALELAVSGRWRSPEASTALAEAACGSARAASDRATALLAEGWLIHLDSAHALSWPARTGTGPYGDDRARRR
jgi:hypothetical protein